MPDYTVRTKKITILETNDIDRARSLVEKNQMAFIQYNPRALNRYMKNHDRHYGERERGQTKSKKS